MWLRTRGRHGRNAAFKYFGSVRIILHRPSVSSTISFCTISGLHLYAGFQSFGVVSSAMAQEHNDVSKTYPGEFATDIRHILREDLRAYIY